MADSIPTPTPAPAPKTKRSRQTINQKHLDEIANSRKVAAAATNTANASTLGAVDFDSTLPTQITALADDTEQKIGALTGSRAMKLTMTAQEKTARDALIAVIAPIQTAARRKYSGDQQDMRHAYFIGEDLHNDNLEESLAAAKAIRDRLNSSNGGPVSKVVQPQPTPTLDTLPGIKDAQIQALNDAITQYGGGKDAQSGQINQNTGALNAIVANIAQLANLRHQVQLAAEQAFPWRSDGVSATRQSFLLPTDRPLPH